MTEEDYNLLLRISGMLMAFRFPDSFTVPSRTEVDNMLDEVDVRMSKYLEQERRVNQHTR